MLLSSLGLLVLIGCGGSAWGFAAIPLMFIVCAGLGASLFAMLPFCLEYGVQLTDPLSKNISAGLMYIVC